MGEVSRLRSEGWQCSNPGRQFGDDVRVLCGDIAKLLGALRKLVEAGHTLVVIEHNLDVIKTADFIVDLGPEGGDQGGDVVTTGTPEQVALVEASHTGRALRQVLAASRSSLARAH